MESAIQLRYENELTALMKAMELLKWASKCNEVLQYLKATGTQWFKPGAIKNL